MAGKYEEVVTKLYLKYVKPMGLPPRLAGEIRHAMEAAAKKSKGDTKATKAAIAAYLEMKGYDEEGTKKPKEKKRKGKKVKKEKKAKKAKKEDDEEEEEEEEEEKPAKKSKKLKAGDADPAKEKLLKAGGKKALKGNVEAGVPKGNIDLRKLNRPTMKGMAADLGVTYKKKLTDDELRASLAKAMTGIDGVALEKLSKADPAKIAGLDNCIGLLIDLTKAICITCPAQTDCRKLFEQHRADGFKVFDDLKPDVKVKDVVEKSKKKKKVKTSNAIVVVPFKKVKKLPLVKVDGALVDNNMEHKDFLRALKVAKPETMEGFKAIVLTSYEADDDDKDGNTLTGWFFKYCEALGVVKTA
jgi:hypothetical protein